MEHKASPGNVYSYAEYVGSVKLFLMAVFSKFKLNSSSRKEIEKIENAHFACFCKFLKSSKDSDELSIDFHPSIEISKREITHNRRIEDNYQFTNYLKAVLSFAGYQEKATYGLGYKITLQKKCYKCFILSTWCWNYYC